MNDNTIVSLTDSAPEEAAEVKARDWGEAPAELTTDSVKLWLSERGARGLISTNAVATIIGCSTRVLKDAERRGELTAVDKCTYTLDAVAGWLVKHPRWVAQGVPHWEITENTLNLAKALLRKTSLTLIHAWHDDVDDLAMEICSRMMRRKRSNNVAESTVIMRVIADIWRDTRRDILFSAKSIDEINEKVERM